LKACGWLINPNREPSSSINTSNEHCRRVKFKQERERIEQQ